MVIITPNNLGTYIREQRLKINMNQTELGKLIGATQRRVSQIENNTGKIDFDVLLAALKILGVTIEVSVQDPDQDEGLW